MSKQSHGKHPSRITFHPRKDSYITEYNAAKNYGGAANLFINRFQGPRDKYRSLIQFDFGCLGGNYIPPGSDIVSAKVELHMFRNEANGAITINAYMVKQNWHEFTVNWNNQPLYAAAPSGDLTIQPGYSGLVLLDITDLTRRWYDGSCVNFGLLLKGHETTNGILGFYSRDYVDSTLWPKLAVEYYMA